MIVSWDEYNQTVEKLAIQIDESGYKPTILIGIMRGAAPMIDVLSRIFKLKCAYLAVESYSGKGVEDELRVLDVNLAWYIRERCRARTEQRYNHQLVVHVRPP